MGRGSISKRITPLIGPSCEGPMLYGINPPFGGLSPSLRQVTHVLLTRPPLIHFPKEVSSLDLHVLGDRKSTRLNSSHANISYAVFCLKKKLNQQSIPTKLAISPHMPTDQFLATPQPLSIPPLRHLPALFHRELGRVLSARLLSPVRTL